MNTVRYINRYKDLITESPYPRVSPETGGVTTMLTSALAFVAVGTVIGIVLGIGGVYAYDRIVTEPTPEMDIDGPAVVSSPEKVQYGLTNPPAEATTFHWYVNGERVKKGETVTLAPPRYAERDVTNLTVEVQAYDELSADHVGYDRLTVDLHLR